MQVKFFKSLLWRLLIPIILIGLLVSLLLSYYLVPPLVSYLQQRLDKTISHTGDMALGICDERLGDMLDLRLEENVEMNNASKREAIEEIKKIATTFPETKIFIFNNSGMILASSFTPPSYQPEELLQSIEGLPVEKKVATVNLFGKETVLHHNYFPFWRWHIVSFIEKDDYFRSIFMAKRIVNIGNFGILLAVVVSVFLLFVFRINRPLKKIILTTEEVRRGNFDRVNLKGEGEIEQVAIAFDNMIEKLREDKISITSILAELQESEEKYRVLSENTLTLVVVANQDMLQYANYAASTFFNLQQDELRTKKIYSLFEAREQKKLQRHIKALAKGISDMEHFELNHAPAEGEERVLEVVASVIPYMGAQSILFHALDVTSRKMMEREQFAMRQKILRAEKMEMLGTLAGGVAHDLNNILGGIVSYPELLLQQLDEKDDLHGPLQTIHLSGLKAAAIVQDLLTLTRRGVIVTEVISPKELLLNYLKSPEHANISAYSPDIKISCDIDDDLLNIKGSPHHLSKCIMNVILNAAEALSEGGTITIRAGNCYVDKPFGNYEEVVEGEYVFISIKDNGKGISKEDLSKIFEPFYTKKVMGRSGTGLGMSVVWGTMKDHNGYIDISSEKDIGTTFTLYFPASRESAQEKEVKEAITLPRGKGERILVVDDIEEQRIIASSILQRLGYKVDVVAGGTEALAALENQEYEVILLDMIMEPGMDGLDTYREILKIRPGQKAIIASGFSETERVRQTMALGAGAYIKKPYSLKTLAIVMAEELGRK